MLEFTCQLFVFVLGRSRPVNLSRKMSRWSSNKETLMMGLVLRISYTAVFPISPPGSANTVILASKGVKFSVVWRAIYGPYWEQCRVLALMVSDPMTWSGLLRESVCYYNRPSTPGTELPTLQKTGSDFHCKCDTSNVRVITTSAVWKSVVFHL